MRRRLLRHLAAIVCICLSAPSASDAADQLLDTDGISDLIGETISNELLVDLNDDDIEDRMIAATNCGNAGCEYFCFVTVSGGQFRFVGRLFVHRLGFEILKSKHNGLSDILSYSRLSASEGSLLRHQFDGSEYQITAKYSGTSGLYALIRPLD